MSDIAESQYKAENVGQRIIRLDVKTFPAGWKVVQLGEVIDIQGGSQPPKSTFLYEPKADYVRLLQIRDFGKKPVPTYVPRNKVTKFCGIEDVLIARYGASLGRILTGMEGAYNVALAKTIFDKEVIFPKYLFYLLQTPLFQTPIHMISRSAQNGFNKGEIYPIEIPIAPLDQQKRIVAEIEKQFSRLDQAVANFKRVKANLKRYKAAVLKAAVEGKLTEEWRKQHPDVEPADKLLERILKERRASWQGRGKYKEPVAPDTADLPELPERWVWATIEQLASAQLRSIQSGPFGSNLKHSEFQPTGKLVVGIDNVQDGYFSMGSENRISESKFLELEKYAARAGDVLITVMATVGRTCVVPDDLEPAIITKHIYRVTPERSLISPRYLHLALWGGAVVRKQMFGQVIGQTRPGLNGSIIKKLAIPVPPLKEQEVIINLVNEKVSIFENTFPLLEKNEMRGERLRQSILKKAFSGKLVPNDPNDEPASVLLEKIKSQRDTVLPGAKLKKKRNKIMEKKLMANLLTVLETASEWVNAQDAFRECGVADGTSTDDIELIYTELRDLVKAGLVEVERRKDEDWLRLLGKA